MCNSEHASTTPAATPGKVDVPDYNERLAYGTDQGRWLMEQVNNGNGGDAAKRRHARTPSRVFEDISGPPMNTNGTTAEVAEVKNGGISATSRSPSSLRNATALYASGAFATLLLIYFLFFRSV